MFSYGYSADSVETRIARHIAKAISLPIRTFTVKPYLLEQLSIVNSCLEGFQDATQARQASIVGRLSATRVLAAHWGDVWLDTTSGAVADVDWTTAYAKFEKRGASWFDENIRYSDSGDPSPEELLRNEWRSYEDIQAPELRLKAFKTDQWSFRWTLASLRMYQAWAFPRLPFYDTRLTDFLLTVPPEFLAGRKLQVEYLKRHAPDLARIPWQAYDTNLFRLQHFNTWLLPKRALKKLGRSLSGRKPIERNWEIQFGGPKQRRSLERILLETHGLHRELFSRKSMEQILGRFYRNWPDPEAGYVVSMLLTLATTSQDDA